MKWFYLLLLLVFVCSATFGQATDTPYQTRYFGNVHLGDSAINLSNTGASSTVASPVQNGDLCANIYVLGAADASMLACCSCQLKPNTLTSVNLLEMLGGTPPPTNSAMVKLMTSIGQPCNASTVGTGANVLATGLVAWGASPRLVRGYPGAITSNFVHSETAFSAATLSAAELVALTAKCAAKAGVFPGICAACKVGAQ